MRRFPVCVCLALLALAPVAQIAPIAPAGADIYIVTLANGTTVETAYQPQDASWDPGMILLLSEVGNWIGIPRDEVIDIRSDFETSGFGRVIDNNTFELGFAPNDAADPDAPPAEGADARVQMLEQMLLQQQQESAQQQQRESYTIPQFVDPSETTGIPSRFIGNPTQPIVRPRQ